MLELELEGWIRTEEDEEDCGAQARNVVGTEELGRECAQEDDAGGAADCA